MKKIKCPLCDEEINSLNVYSDICQTAKLKKGKLEIYGLSYCEGYNFCCENCGEQICETEEQAEMFLKTGEIPLL